MAEHNGSMVKDPKLAISRIFIGNIPVCTKEELESIAIPYGKPIDSLVQKNYGFIQFESEEIANKAAKALNKSLFKGNQISVRNAGHKKRPNPNAPGAAAAAAANKQPFPAQVQGFNHATRNNPDYNDCEIIVVDRQNTAYAEYIENRLKTLGLQVDVLFPNEEVSLGKVLANISSRGCMYAILVTPQNEELRSITVNILYGVPAEHRNMPVDDAINLIGDDFRLRVGPHIANSNLPKAVQVIAPSNVAAPPLKERHPDGVQTLLNLLADNLQLTVLQYDCIIKYLQERREFQLKLELGDAATNAGAQPDPEIELQKKILNILNKPSVAETHYELLYPSLESVKGDYRAMDLLKDVRVQNAIDSILTSSLMATIEKHMKF
ncbi:nuclear receptor coactivator 5 [Episyrphus balteatus]|uniref:nuclear receptor coactivator 5 n=1 Tax=Episyrphus balteatus TaxID=286459 RepID=UPI0024867181|nr:nuclear receptor coactivator 5 [Episyrphus balteatus]